MKQAGEEQILSQQPDPVKFNKAVIYTDKELINPEYRKHQSCMQLLKHQEKSVIDDFYIFVKK